jgi:hypothetical protein
VIVCFVDFGGIVDHGVSCHFQQYFSYIVVVSFNGGENCQPVASD